MSQYHLNLHTAFLGSKQDVTIMIICAVNDFMEFIFKTIANFLIASVLTLQEYIWRNLIVQSRVAYPRYNPQLQIWM